MVSPFLRFGRALRALEAQKRYAGNPMRYRGSIGTYPPCLAGVEAEQARWVIEAGRRKTSMRFGRSM